MKRARYYLYENYGLPPHVGLSDAQLLQMGRAIAYVASADGVLAPEEQAHLVALIESCGASEETLGALANYVHEPQAAAPTHLATDPIPPGVILYEAIRVAYSDREYSQAERAAVRTMAGLLGVDGRTVELIEHLVESERTLRQMRMALLWPGAEEVDGGFPSAGGSV